MEWLFGLHYFLFLFVYCLLASFAYIPPSIRCRVRTHEAVKMNFFKTLSKEIYFEAPPLSPKCWIVKVIGELSCKNLTFFLITSNNTINVFLSSLKDVLLSKHDICDLKWRWRHAVNFAAMLYVFTSSFGVLLKKYVLLSNNLITFWYMQRNSNYFILYLITSIP